MLYNIVKAFSDTHGQFSKTASSYGDINMLRHTMKHNCLLAALTVILVISLNCVVWGATAPVVTVLKPISQLLRSPVRMALDAAGNSYVADPRNSGIIKFNPYGVAVQTMPTAGVPQGVAIAQDGKLLVSQGTFVAILNPDGSEAGRLAGTFQSANGIAVDDVTGYIYVTDSGAHEVQVYTASGAFSKRFGSRGTLAGQLMMPTGITFEKTARQLAVADTLNSRIQFFDINGVYVKTIGAPGSGPMKFASPQGVAFEYSTDAVPVLNRMYVVDAYQGNVQVIDPAGTGAALYISGTNPLNNYIGSYGGASGQLMTPTDVIFDRQNSRLLVVNGFGNVSTFGIDGGSNPVDKTPPTLSIDPVLANVSTANLTISGTVDAGSSVVVTLSTTAVAAPVVVSASSIAWKCDITGLVGGDNVITATATNANGISASQSVTVKYTLPAPVITFATTNPSLTNIANQVISGTVDAGSTVTVTNTATTISGDATVVGTAWSFPVALAEGPNHLTVTAQKPMSDKGSAAIDVTLDTIAPKLVVSALANGSYTSTQVQNIAGTVSDANAVSVLVNNQPVAVANGAFSTAVTLVIGANTVSVLAVDAAGNVAADTRTINFDNTQPVITVSAPMDNSLTNATTVTVTGMVDKTSTVVVAGAAAAMNGNLWSADVTLLPGLNTIEIVATDLYGNSSVVKRSVVQDSIKPVLAIISPAQDLAVNTSTITISGTVSDSVGVMLMYSVNGVTVPVPVVAGAFSFILNFTAEGVYPVLLTATDAAGNVTTATRNVIYDITPPALTIAAYNGAAPAILTGTVEPGATVVVFENGVSIGKVTVDTVNGSWQADLTGISYNPKLLTVVATDAAGNTTVKTLTLPGAGATKPRKTR